MDNNLNDSNKLVNKTNSNNLDSIINTNSTNYTSMSNSSCVSTTNGTSYTSNQNSSSSSLANTDSNSNCANNSSSSSSNFSNSIDLVNNSNLLSSNLNTTSSAAVVGSLNDQCDMTSIEVLNKCHLDLFPKKKPVCDDTNSISIAEQLPFLNGEYIQFIGPSGKLNEEILIMTNFRIFLLMHNNTSFINVPLMLIESIEVKEIFFIYVYLKNVKTIRLTFSTNEKTCIWYQRINSFITRVFDLDELFAFTFYSWLTNEKLDDNSENTSSKCLFSRHDQSNLTYKEFKRMKFDSKLWRISEVNKKLNYAQHILKQ